MKIAPLLLLVLSAVLYVLPFWYTAACWGLIFFFPLPFFIVAFTKDISFTYGFIWGLFVFTFHLSGGIHILYRMARDDGWIAICIGSAMVLYYALTCGAFCTVTSHLVRYYGIKNKAQLLFFWLVALFFIICFVDQYSLAPFGCIEGYPLMHPLLPLSHYSLFLYWLPIVGKYVCTIMLLLISWALLLLWRHKNAHFFCFFICALGWWLLPCIFFREKVEQVEWYNRIASLPLMVRCTGDDPRVIMKMVA